MVRRDGATWRRESEIVFDMSLVSEETSHSHGSATVRSTIIYHIIPYVFLTVVLVLALRYDTYVSYHNDMIRPKCTVRICIFEFENPP